MAFSEITPVKSACVRRSDLIARDLRVVAEPSREIVRPGAAKDTLFAIIVRCFNPTFAVESVSDPEPLCFQQGVPRGLHYIFSVGAASDGTAAMRGGGWLGSVSWS